MLTFLPVEKRPDGSTQPTTGVKLEVATPDMGVVGYELNALLTIPATQGKLYSFSGYRIAPFALYAGGGEPPIMPWDKTVEPNRQPVSIAVQTITNWQGDQVSISMPILKHGKRKEDPFKKAGKMVAKTVVGAGTRVTDVVIEIVGKRHGVDPSTINQTKSATGQAAQYVENQVDQIFNVRDDVVLGLNAGPLMVNGQMAVKLSLSGQQNNPNTYGGYNIKTANFSTNPVVLDDVKLANVAGEPSFVFQPKQGVPVIVTTDKHDKKLEATKQLFLPADGPGASKTVQIDIFPIVYVSRATHKTTMYFEYKLGKFSVNPAFASANDYPLADTWFEKSATPKQETGVLKNQTANTTSTDFVSNFK